MTAAATAVVLTGEPAWATPNRVTVRTDQPMDAIAPGAIGADTPLWNKRLLDRQVPGLVRQAAITTLEFNGGGVSDLYHWRDGSLSPDPDAANHPVPYNNLKPQFSFDEFERVARSAGAGTVVHVNYGTGTPEEAAAWVRYANKVKHYGVKDWIIGEEVWGNGSIPGINIEPDAHADKSPTAYGTNAVQFIKAMKEVDPTIRVGIEVAGFNVDKMRQWDRAVLAAAGPAIDFVDFHRYPIGDGNLSDQELFAQVRQVPIDVGALRTLVDQYAGPHHRVDLLVGETNSSPEQTAQQISPFNALYLVENNLSLLENGVRSVGWWALHSGRYALTGGGDLGLLSTGDCNDTGTVCAPPADTPFPPYYGMQILGAVAQAGGRPLPVATGNDLVVGHAVREPNGQVAVVLVNEDPTNTQQVLLDVPGYRTGTVLSYAAGDEHVQVSHETAVRTLPAYSVTAVFLHR